MQASSSGDEVTKGGEIATVSLFNGKVQDNVNKLRVRKFHEKTASSTAMVQPQTLPPTSAATKYHSLRVYHQVQVWKGNEVAVPPEQWGWKVVNGLMVPVLSDLPPAPQELLEVIRCSCKTGCHTVRCTCKKNGMECTVACSECRGICANMSTCDASDNED